VGQLFPQESEAEAGTVGLLKTSHAERERQRFYLFAGMGGRPARRKHRTFLLGALITAMVASAALMGLFYWINTV
jgi:hypothetical protein